MALRLAVGFDEDGGDSFAPTVGPGTGYIGSTWWVQWISGVHGGALGRDPHDTTESLSVINSGLSGLGALDTPSWTAMTVMAWVLPHDMAGSTERWPVVLMGSDHGDDGWMGWRIGNNSRRVASSFSGSLIETSTDIIADPTTWQHFCTTWDGTAQRLYIDGSEVASGPVSGTLPATTHASIGAMYWSYGAQGVDDFRVYDEALSTAQINNLMTLAVGQEGDTSPVNKLSVGAAVPDKLYVGSTEVERVYQGSTLVYGEDDG